MAARKITPANIVGVIDSLNVIRSLAFVVGEACANPDDPRDSALATTIYEGIVCPLEKAGEQLSAIARRR